MEVRSPVVDEPKLAGAYGRARLEPHNSDYFALLSTPAALAPGAAMDHGQATMHCLPGADPFPAELASEIAAAIARRPESKPRTRHLDAEGRPCFSNRLAREHSPYLLQHAHNPVNWYPWGDEAFADARRLNRPVFLSIGYSTCHWCHVMEEESFEDETIAAFLNAHFVAIKVDREERPDIDALYMRAAQRLTGSGGWPLSVWLTAAKEPFFAGTYFPPHAGVRGAQMGFLEILTELVRLHHDESPRVEEAAQSLTRMVRTDLETTLPARPADSQPGPSRKGLDLVRAAVEECRRGYDDQCGGLRLPQKFPSHVPVRLLLRHHQRTGDRQALHMAVHTLENMAMGGIYDHLAGGFHRYATDRQWLVPHFEKMLYDNALLVVAYCEGWQVSKRPDFERVVRETCDEMLATFVSPDGGFYSATDADSEGEEGKYFVWGEGEIRALLGEGDDTELFLRHYGVTAGGNSELGNVLHQHQVNEDITRRLAPARAKLLRARALRAPPLRDDKILAAWNGLAISAFATAGRVLDEPKYLTAATGAAEFVLARMRHHEEAGLARSSCAGSLGAPGFLDDYAFVAAGLLDLFESTHESRWFLEALRLCEEIQSRFADEETGAWFMTGTNHERLLARERPVFDGAEPAGSSVAFLNVARLAAFTGDERWHGVAERALSYYLPAIEAQPVTMAHALLAVDFLAGPTREIVIATPNGDSEAARPFQQVLRERFTPRRVLFIGQADSGEWRKLQNHLALLDQKPAKNGHVTAYVCQQGTCELPTTDPEQFAQQIGR
jgi:uncharacterized protein